MKKKILALSAVLLLSLASVVYASDSIQAVLFPVAYEFNGKTKELPDELVTLNYENRAYIPARFVAENLGARVSYDPDQQVIRFNNSNRFDAATLQIGDTIAGMEVKEFDLQQADDEYVGTVQFSGSALVTGTFSYTMDERLGELLLFTVDRNSQQKLPQLSHDTRTLSFVFTNTEDAKRMFGVSGGTAPASGKVAVEIDEFFLNYQHKDVFNTAKLNDVYVHYKN